MTQITPDSIETPNAYVPWREFLGSAYAASLALVCLAVWLHAADSLIVATMLPSIVAEIGGAALVSWSVSIYEIGSIVAGAAAALLTMRHGLRGPMSLSAALFGAGCALSAMSPTMTILLVGRGLQGLGGGGLVAMCFVAIGVLFPRRYAARALAAVSTFWGISAFLGPLIGGIFVEYATWRLGFWFFAAQAFGLALWIALRGGIARPAAPTEMDRFPITRLVLLCFAVVLISLGGVRVEPLTTTLYVGAGLACLGWFLWRDGRAGSDRLLPARPVDPRHATGATLLMLFLLSMATVAVAGFAYAVPQGPLWLIALCALFEGGGFGLAWTFILRRITALVAEDEVQRVSGAMPTVQRLGYALGAAYVGIIANASGFLTMDRSAEAEQVARWVFLSCLPLALAGLLAMWGLVRRHDYDATLG